MENKKYDMIVIGGGPAGLAAAYCAWQKGLRRILVIERDKELGGILNQCIHNGFGLHYFKEDLTGPEYAERFVNLIYETNIEILTDTMVLSFSDSLYVHAVGKTIGYAVFSAKSIVLAMGCRERTRGAIGIAGSRPAGIFTAGTAQRYCNMEGYMVGRRVVILGSGDIGLIMARRMTLEGAEVLACVEIMPYSGGLTRNIVQCLYDYNIPLYLSHTITEIRGKKRVEQVVISKVDENRRSIPGTETEIDCDTILFSVGLIPENELTRVAGVNMDNRTGGAYVNEQMETSLPGVFACGNVLHVHDLVDYVSVEGERAGVSAAEYVLLKKQENKTDLLSCKNNIKNEKKYFSIASGSNVSYTVPQIFNRNTASDLQVFFRVNRIFHKSKIIVTCGEKQIASFTRAHMAPGEMEKVTISQKLLPAINGEIKITCKEAEL